MPLFLDAEALAWQRFSVLSDAEVTLLRAVPQGTFAYCGPNKSDKDPANDPSGASGWGKERWIRAEVIRWLCVDEDAKQRIDPRGIRVHGAKITGSLDLSYVDVPFGIALHRCAIVDRTDLSSMKILELDLEGTWTCSIDADSAEVKGALSFKDAHVEGQVRLPDVHVEGPLDCSGATLNNPRLPGVDGTGTALQADRLHVEGGVFLKDRFNATGKVALLSAEIEGDLECSGGSFSNPLKPGGTETRTALSLDSASINGCVFLKSGFSANGEVRMLGASIGGQLACIEATFRGEFSAQTAIIQGAFFWQQLNNPAATELNLINASAGSIVDDRASWPAQDHLYVAGFVYEHISGADTPRDAESRLEWLARQPQFYFQPYRQLATVLRKEGDDTGARRVLYVMEQRRRQQGNPNWVVRFWSFVLNATTGYGYYPQRSLICLLILVALGFAFFATGYAIGSIAPTDKEAYPTFKQNSSLPERYARFNPFIYSLENSFPLIKLGQADLWQPDPNPEWQCGPRKSFLWLLCRFVSPTPLRVFRWAQIYFGWFFATMGVAAVTGIVRKD